MESCDTFECSHFRCAKIRRYQGAVVVVDDIPVALSSSSENEEESPEMIDSESSISSEHRPRIHYMFSPEEQLDPTKFDFWAYMKRAKEVQEGIDLPPGCKPVSLLQLSATNASTAPQDMDDISRKLASIYYILYLDPDLLEITNCPYYWGKIDMKEAERLLENLPLGTFLLRDSMHEDFLYSVSYRYYGSTYHSRIEQWNRRFSFNSKDIDVFDSSTVCGLIDYYKDFRRCTFFEPMLTAPLLRNFTFSLQQISRAVVCNKITYDDVDQLKLPIKMKSFLKEYHYKQHVKCVNI